MLSEILDLNSVFGYISTLIALNPTFLNFGHVLVSIDNLDRPLGVSYQRLCFQLDLRNWQLVFTVKFLSWENITVKQFWLLILKRLKEIRLSVWRFSLFFESMRANGTYRPLWKIQVEIKPLFFQRALLRLELLLHCKIFANVFLNYFDSLYQSVPKFLMIFYLNRHWFKIVVYAKVTNEFQNCL